MEMYKRSWSLRIGDFARAVFWLALAGFTLFMLYSVFAHRNSDGARTELLKRFEKERGSRVISLIHRQESTSVFGVAVDSHISIEDSEAVLRAIRLTPPEQPIDLILHTPGGLVLASEQIAKALVERKGKVTVFIPHYAMSGGTMIALAADEIVMDNNAVLGPVDPQIGGMPAGSIVNLLALKNRNNISDEMLILADVAQKARVQVAGFITQVLMKHMPEKKAFQVATILSEGRWTHDFPLIVPVVRELGLNVTTEMPRLVYDLMDLYPQGRGARPSVMVVPMRKTRDEREASGPPAAPRMDE